MLVDELRRPQHQDRRRDVRPEPRGTCMGICDRIIERGYDLNIWAYTRVDTIKDGMLDKLKARRLQLAGLRHRGRPASRVRDDVDKAFGQDEVFRTVDRVRAAGINVIGNYIFGLPEDDLETMQATLDLALELNCEFANFYSAMAYPGSPLYEPRRARRLAAAREMDRLLAAFVRCLPLPTKYLSGPKCCASAITRLTCTSIDTRYLGMIEDKFGIETARDLKRMTKHQARTEIARHFELRFIKFCQILSEFSS